MLRSGLEAGDDIWEASQSAGAASVRLHILGLPVIPWDCFRRLCTAEVRGSTPLRSTTDLQVDRGLRTPQRTPETGRCNHSATQIAALGWERTGRDGCGGDAETGPETIGFLGFSLCQCAPLASVQEVAVGPTQKKRWTDEWGQTTGPTRQSPVHEKLREAWGKGYPLLH